MPLILKEFADTEGLPTITLAGGRYFVAKLPLRARIAAATLPPKVQAISKELPSKKQIEEGALVELTEDDYLTLVDVIRHALSSLYPSITREDLLEQPIEFDELFAAYPVVIAQGMSRRAAMGEVTWTSLLTGDGSG